MWDKPETLTLTANILFGIAAALAVYAALHYFVHLSLFPLREVRLAGDVSRITREQVKIIVEREMKGNFFTADLTGVQRAFEKLPWVRSVNVRRVFPQRLDVSLEQHIALARWNCVEPCQSENPALVNVQGELFDAALDAELPVFSGPPGTSRDIAERYVVFSRSLEPLQRHLAGVSLSSRRAWRLRLDNGTVIELGREQMEQRLTRFVAVFDSSVGRLQRKIEYVDLRYANGFAVRIPEIAHEKPDVKNRKAGVKKAA